MFQHTLDSTYSRFYSAGSAFTEKDRKLTNNSKRGSSHGGRCRETRPLVSPAAAVSLHSVITARRRARDARKNSKSRKVNSLQVNVLGAGLTGKRSQLIGVVASRV